jgi:hypothetical protein
MVNGRACGETMEGRGGEARQTEQTDRNEPREHQPFQVSPFLSFPAPSQGGVRATCKLCTSDVPCLNSARTDGDAIAFCIQYRKF